MFKKPLADLKTSAPLRGSDRRKLRQRIISEFRTSNEDGDLLVPDGIHTQKFKTHVDEPGVLYLSSEGDPLWFTIGKGSDALIPTVYTLWKQPSLLPSLTTPAAVVPKLVGGADLMIPGGSSIQASRPALDRFSARSTGSVTGYPIAVGSAAVPSEILKQADETDMKGKAVHVLHTWKDALWEMGPSKKLDLPEPRSIVTTAPNETTDDDSNNDTAACGEAQGQAEGMPVAESAGNKDEEGSQKVESSKAMDQNQASAPSLGPEDVSSCLRNALLQAITTTLASQPPTTFPMSASVFWNNYVLPARPAQALGPNGLVSASAIDIKQSTHKSVKVFLKACAKEGLLKLKETKGDVVVTGVSPQHPSAVAHRPHRTLQSAEMKREKAEARERKAKEEEEKKNTEIQVSEFLKPFGSTIGWFVAAEKDTGNLYTSADVRDIFNEYISSKKLINGNNPQYVNIGDDEALAGAVWVKGQDTPEFMKRDDTIKKIQAHMENWHEIRAYGGDVVRKKGEVKRVSVMHKMRQGRKAVTLIQGFELFGLNADELAEELRKICSSSTSVAPLPGKAAGTEVMVQGKQMKAVLAHLVSKGVPQKWITTADMLDSKKK